MSQSRPHFILLDLFSKLCSSSDILNIVKQHINGIDIQLELLVNLESFFVQLIIFSQSDLGNIRSIIILESLDIIHDSIIIFLLDGSDDQQILEFFDAWELGMMENNLLEQWNEFFL